MDGLLLKACVKISLKKLWLQPTGQWRCLSDAAARSWSTITGEQEITLQGVGKQRLSSRPTDGSRALLLACSLGHRRHGKDHYQGPRPGRLQQARLVGSYPKKSGCHCWHRDLGYTKVPWEELKQASEQICDATSGLHSGAPLRQSTSRCPHYAHTHPTDRPQSRSRKSNMQRTEQGETPSPSGSVPPATSTDKA